MSTSVPTSGPIAFSNFRTVFTGPTGALAFSLFLGVTNGIPGTGELKMSHFRGKSALGYGSIDFILDASLSMYGRLFKITCSAANYTNGVIFYPSTSATDTIVYYMAFRASGSLLGQNSYSGAWGTEEYISYSTLGITNSAPWVIFLRMDQPSFKLFDTSGQQTGTFTNRFVQSVIRRIQISFNTMTVVQVLDMR